MSKLSDLLNSQPVTARQAAEIADQRGVTLPYGTIAAYWSGRHGRPSAQTLERLAEVLTIPIEQLQKAAWNKTAPVETWNPPAEVRLLNERQRRALDELIRSFAATQGASNEDTSTQSTPSDPTPHGKARPRRTPMKLVKDTGRTDEYQGDDLDPPPIFDEHELAAARDEGVLSEEKQRRRDEESDHP